MFGRASLQNFTKTNVKSTRTLDEEQSTHSRKEKPKNGFKNEWRHGYEQLQRFNWFVVLFCLVLALWTKVWRRSYCLCFLFSFLSFHHLLLHHPYPFITNFRPQNYIRWVEISIHLLQRFTNSLSPSQKLSFWNLVKILVRNHYNFFIWERTLSIEKSLVMYESPN